MESSNANTKQNALYNWNSKYNNLKSEMAGEYIRRLLRKELRQENSGKGELTDTLFELFRTFFPGKTYDGPTITPDGSLEFNVTTTSGAKHDIDDLSSGEKEVLYGYLRMRNSTPQNSVLLIDEPEVHLNPRLVTGLVRFYHNNLGKPFGNQLWLVTHSDTIIREAVGQPDFSIFHLQPANTEANNQAVVVKGDSDLEQVILDLVGDLAVYRPRSKVVFFEGGGEDKFDIQMVGSLFPEFTSQVNAISVGNKHHVGKIHELLHGHLTDRFYAITDSDSELTSQQKSQISNRFSWDVYHIENYLLQPKYILLALREIGQNKPPFDSEPAIHDALRESAEAITNNVIHSKLSQQINDKVISAINLGINRASTDLSGAFVDAIRRSSQKLNDVVSSELSETAIRGLEEEIRQKVTVELSNGDWINTFPGRDILKNFCNRAVHRMPFVFFRNSMVNRMQQDAFKPSGMKSIIDQIMGDS